MKKDKHKTKIKDLLKAHRDGLTIAEVMKKTKLARHTVLARLHHLVGRGKVRVREINRAKVHYWKRNVSTSKRQKHPAHAEVKLNKLEKEHIKTRPKKQKLQEVAQDIKKALKAKENLKESKLKEELAEERAKEAHIEEEIAETKAEETQQEAAFDMAAIKEQITRELKGGKISQPQAKIKEDRAPITHIIGRSQHQKDHTPDEFIRTGIPGFDELLVEGIPKGNAVIVAGGTGSGKTILTLQMLNEHMQHGENCLYMSFEESEESLIHHMEDFGWDPKKYIKKGNLLIKRFNPFDITRSVDALLMKAKGELLIDVQPVIFPDNFKPDIIVVDSLTAISSAFTEKEDSYRIYIEQLFRFFETIHATSFLITETQQIPTVFSQTGVEEFLADGVIVLYAIKRGNVRENAIEVLKLRGAKHQKKIVAMQITDDGIVVYPDQEVFGGLD